MAVSQGTVAKFMGVGCFWLLLITIWLLAYPHFDANLAPAKRRLFSMNSGAATGLLHPAFSGRDHSRPHSPEMLQAVVHAGGEPRFPDGKRQENVALEGQAHEE
ncbi:hypothetical protein DRE_00735 [Drechslerella stenobrocha 248]|uniref:Uncharacterized protein n=1 Tax=Drechslerella stenobrocha 248 TaxID=1043628 RepID=W7HMT9_9PEZI|nr:hypothetical protein DRE_00735 [Drechslerella stenobrocha 248]